MRTHDLRLYDAAIILACGSVALDQCCVGQGLDREREIGEREATVIGERLYIGVWMGI